MHRFKRTTIGLLVGISIASLMIAVLPERTSGRQAHRSTVVQRLVAIFKKKVHPRGTRGPICLLTPQLGNETQLWSDRPLFTWRPEKVTRVQVQVADSQAIIWEHSITTDQNSVIYAGPALQPEQSYEVILWDSRGRKLRSKTTPQFTLVSAADRIRITTTLDGIEHQLRNQQRTVEEIAIAKAQYLLEQGFVSDAFQIVNAVPNTAASLQRVVHEVASYACDGSELNAVNPH